MTEYTIFHLDINGTVTKTLGRFESGMTLDPSILHHSYTEDYLYYHPLKNPWVSSGICEDVDDFEGNYEEYGDYTSSEEEFGTLKDDPISLNGYSLVLHSYNDRIVKPKHLSSFKHKVLNGVLKDLIPESMYYGNAAIIKTDLRDDSVENVEKDWEELADLIRKQNWVLDIDGHIQHGREYKIIGREVATYEILEHCPMLTEIKDRILDPRDIYDHASREIHLHDINSPLYSVYGSINELYLGKRLDFTTSKKMCRPGFREKGLEDWLQKVTGNGEWEPLTIVSWLN